MNVQNLLLTPKRSEAHYRGPYVNTTFDLLDDPVPVYKNLLLHLRPFGADLSSLKYEVSTLADATVSCLLLDLNVAVRARLDRLEIDFWKIHETGLDVASKILTAACRAVLEADASVQFGMHVVDVSVLAEIEQLSYRSLLGRYVSTPPGLEHTEAGLGFYSRRDDETGTEFGHVILDRVIGQDKLVLLKISAGFNAAGVKFEQLAEHVDRYSTVYLQKLGLGVSKADGK